MAYSVTIQGDGVEVPRKLRAALRDPQLRKVMARANQQHLREHFFNRDRTHANKLGGKRTHFWAQVARSTTSQVQFDGYEIDVNHVGARQRLLGGTIRPVKVNYLTIPATAEAHGKRAREFDDLHVEVIGGKLALVQSQSTQVKFRRGKFVNRGEVGGRVFYWLRKQVTQKPDPSVLPKDAEMGRVAVKAAEDYVDTKIGGGGA